MLISGYYPIPIVASLIVVAVVITGSILASLAFPKASTEEVHLPKPHRELAEGESALEITTPEKLAHHKVEPKQ
jgi:hypothetical protein